MYLPLLQDYFFSFFTKLPSNVLLFQLEGHPLKCLVGQIYW
jgi:hypothetical protein